MAIQKVLIVDDSKTELMFLTDLLQKNGLRCERPRTPKRRFAAWRRTSPT